MIFTNGNSTAQGTIISRGDGYVASRDEALSRYKLVTIDSYGNVTGTNYYITKEELMMGIDQFENGETQYKPFGVLKDGSQAMEIINVNRMKKTVDRSYAIAEITEDKTVIKETFQEMGELAKAVVETEYGINVDRLKNAFLNYVLSDLQAVSDPSYVIDMLEQAGIDEKEAKRLGLEQVWEMNKENDRE